MAGKNNTVNNKRKNSPTKEDIAEEDNTKRAKTVEEQFEGKNPGNVIGGLKATLKNENASDEAKEHAEKMLEQASEEMDLDTSDKSRDSDRRQRRYRDQFNKEGKDISHSIAGYKGVLARSDVSDEAKDHAKQMLEELEGHQSAGGHLGHVISGYKDRLRNEKADDKEKTRSRKVLEELGGDDDYEYSSRPGDERLNLEGKDIGHVIGGYKATLSNSNVSEEAKEHAKKMLEELEGHQSSGRHLGHAMHKYRSKLSDEKSSKEDKEHSRRVLKEFGDDEHNYSYRRDERYNKEGKELSHVIGGYKATLSNPNVSEEAKEHARKMLSDKGADLETHHSKGAHLGNVIGGYKATLSNPNVSDEAKEHAKQMLEELGAEEYEYSHKYQRTHHARGGNFNNVMGGYKATLHNENASEEAKEHAAQVLEENGVDADSKLGSGKDDSEKNPGNVIGGIKAAINNPNVSESTKEDLRSRLDSQLEKTAH